MSDEKIDEITSEPSRKKSSLSWRSIGIFCSAFSIVVLILAGGYACWSFINANMQMTSLLHQTQSQLQQVQSDLSTLKTQTALAQQASTDDLKNLKQIITKLSEEKQNNQEKWQFIEARYYVKLANNNLQFMHHVPSAISLLKLSDQILSQMANPKASEIRKAIAIDITNLQRLPQIDLAGLYSKLMALNNQLDQLPLQAKQKVPEPSSIVSEQNQTAWQRSMHMIWNALKSLVVVRYNPNGSMPLMTPDQQVFLYQNLHAMLQQSIWALLNQQPEIYQTSLQQLTEWINRYFVPDASMTRAVLNTISQLERTDLHPPALTLMNTLEAFNGV